MSQLRFPNICSVIIGTELPEQNQYDNVLIALAISMILLKISKSVVIMLWIIHSLECVSSFYLAINVFKKLKR